MIDQEKDLKSCPLLSSYNWCDGDYTKSEDIWTRSNEAARSLSDQTLRRVARSCGAAVGELESCLACLLAFATICVTSSSGRVALLQVLVAKLSRMQTGKPTVAPTSSVISCIFSICSHFHFMAS